MYSGSPDDIREKLLDSAQDADDQGDSERAYSANKVSDAINQSHDGSGYGSEQRDSMRDSQGPGSQLSPSYRSQEDDQDDDDPKASRDGDGQTSEEGDDFLDQYEGEKNKELAIANR